MKRVLVNDWVLTARRAGVGVYLDQVVAHWPQRPTVQLIGVLTQVVGRRAAMPTGKFVFPDLQALGPIELKPLSEVLKCRDRFISRAKRWVRPPLAAAYGGLLRGVSRVPGYSGFFEPNHIPLANLCPMVTTMHDLSVLELPQFHPHHRIAHWSRRLQRALQWTRHWVCDSKTIAGALERILGVAGERITVIPLASRWSNPPEAWTPERIRQSLGLEDRYLVCVGTIEPRKNIGRLLDAYAMLQPSRRRHTRLILAGSPGWGDAAFWESLREHPMTPTVLATGYLGDAEVAALVLGAEAMIYPSVYEGFGLPPLEAMSLGVPTAASTATTLMEVCGEGALLIDPEDTEAWAETMVRLSEPGKERTDLIERGRRRAACFSWKKTAQLHHDLFDRVFTS